ncbi:electron transport complex subunit G [Steroidobacter agaridevorans]|uniref:Ion-translocating oxidoreductase complex subunit G n=1 Tax=Steroidobacter agaridevorans TaxID=2695856 RepID=A0A829YNL3_9GAMM|nr:electron transport complex subunit RsxG [Steroidobacter agaridevorans]GFE84551.1 electron transport complex subunit G [Steroidobacter agaridevorans]GFE90950.1 electron transport complex subunit G [Steroidobacter agaridevorans]
MATPADKRHIAVPTATLAIIAAVLTVGLVTFANLTRDRIARNQQVWIKQHLDALVPPQSYDNDPLVDTTEVTAPDLLGTTTPVTAYRMRKAGLPVAVAIRSIAPDGYRGPLELLVAIAPGGQLLGVQVIRHDETPGLGDAFENRDAGWLDKFRGLSLTKPPQQRWTVRRDGGDFDAFTGATITPRAIVKAVRRTLEFYQGNEDRLYRDGQPR